MRYLMISLFFLFPSITIAGNSYTKTDCIISVEPTDARRTDNSELGKFQKNMTDYLFDNTEFFRISSNFDYIHYFLFAYEKGCEQKKQIIKAAIQSYQQKVVNPFEDFDIVASGIEAGDDTIDYDHPFFAD